MSRRSSLIDNAETVRCGKRINQAILSYEDLKAENLLGAHFHKTSDSCSNMACLSPTGT